MTRAARRDLEILEAVHAARLQMRGQPGYRDHLSPETRALLDAHVAKYEAGLKTSGVGSDSYRTEATSRPAGAPEEPGTYSADGYAEVASAARACFSARQAIRLAKVWATRVAVPWDGSGGLVTVTVADCKVYDRDLYYVTAEQANALEQFFAIEWARKP